MPANMSCPDGSLLDQSHVRVTMIVTYVIVFLSCFLGNILILVVICWHQAMRTVTNFFLANLAVADLFVGLFCVVQNMMQLHAFGYAHWPFGAFLCHLYVFTLQLGPCASAAILLLMSIERFIVVMFPVTARNLLTARSVTCATAVAWLISLLSSVPYYLTAEYATWVSDNGTFHGCYRREVEGISLRSLVTSNFVLWYVVPVFILAVLYTKIGHHLWHSISIHEPVLVARSSTKRRQKSSSAGRINVSNSAAEGTVLLHRPARSSQLIPGQRPRKSLSFNPGSRAADENENNRDKKYRSFSVGHRFRINSIFRSSPDTDESTRDHTQETRLKVIRLLIVVTVSYAVLTLPHHGRQLWLVWRPASYHHCLMSPMALLQPICYLLLFSNSGCNPFLYAFLSERFRTALVDTVRCRNIRERNRRHVQERSVRLKSASEGGLMIARIPSASCSSIKIDTV